MKAYFKLEVTSTLGQQMLALWQKARDLDNTAKNLVNELGGQDHIRQTSAAGGGIKAIKFDTQPDIKIWRCLDKSHSELKNFYYPRRKNKAGKILCEKIEALEIIERSEFNALVNFKNHCSSEYGTLCFHSSIGLFLDSEAFYITFYMSSDYVPPTELQEILPSEFREKYDEYMKKGGEL